MLLPGHPRPPPAPQPAQNPGLRRQVEPPGQLLSLFYCTVLVCSKETSALTDFSGYLTKLLQNHTAYACDGDYLNLQCPRHSTISVQSAFYGQDYQMCGSQEPASQREDNLTCVASTTLQKVLDECQSQRACHLLVNSRVFGPDLCPGSSKYLLVSFKCQPSFVIDPLRALSNPSSRSSSHSQFPPSMMKANTPFKSSCSNCQLLENKPSTCRDTSVPTPYPALPCPALPCPAGILASLTAVPSASLQSGLCVASQFCVLKSPHHESIGTGKLGMWSQGSLGSQQFEIGHFLLWVAVCDLGHLQKLHCSVVK